MSKETNLDLIDEEMDWEPDEDAPKWLIYMAAVVGSIAALTILTMLIVIFTPLLDGVWS